MFEHYVDLPWRIGRKIGRTIYAVLGDEPSDDDPLIGVMDSPTFARSAVDGHNMFVKPKSASRKGRIIDDRPE